MFPETFSRLTAAGLLLLAASVAQEQPKESKPKDQPEVRVNYLNVCTPNEAEQQEIRAALSRLPAPRFTPDFEVSRGRSTLEQAPTSNWVRLRHEFAANVPFLTAQYSISVDEKSIIESLVFRSREAKDVLQVQLEDTVTGAQDVSSVLATNTPVNRIKLERFGKASLVLARCPTADQKLYEPLFRKASEVLANYRTALNIKRLIPRELAMLGPINSPPKASATPKKK
jgi:hypothetical protein